MGWAADTGFIKTIVGKNANSSWNNFLGGTFKFISMQINVSDQRVITARETKDWFSALGDFGGLLGILQTAGLVIFGVFAEQRLNSLITEDFFTWAKEPEDYPSGCCPRKNPGTQVDSSGRLRSAYARDLTQTEIPTP